MKSNEIKKVAGQIAANCKTCKEIANRFPELVNKYGKEDAIKIQGVAKGILKDSNLAIKSDSDDAINFLKSNKVAKIALKEYLKENGKNRFVCVLVNNVFGGDIDGLCKKYYSYVSDKGVFLNRKKIENENGTISFEYYEKNTNSVNGYLSVLKKAIQNAKYCAIGGDYDKIHTIIDSANIIEK